jgi:hypothetical protein
LTAISALLAFFTSFRGIPGMVYPRPTVSACSGIIDIIIINDIAAFATTLQTFLCPWIN